jgi:hypothetical protein
MAKLRSLTKASQDVRAHTTQVDATFQLLTGTDGTLLFQLSTYGSDTRQSKPKVSQTIQLDAEFAQKLKKELEIAFGI